MSISGDLNKFASSLPLGAPPIAVTHPRIGAMGFVSCKQGFRVDGISHSAFDALERDQYKATMDIRWVKRFLGKAFKRDVDANREIRRLLRKERGTIATWDDIVSARVALQVEDTFYFKELITAGTFPRAEHYFRVNGNPSAGSYTNITGGSVLNNASTGAWRLTNPASGNKYITNTGNGGIINGMMLLTDLLVAAGNISATTTGAQTINTTALTRYTGTASAGNMIAIEVTSTLGSNGSSASTVTYTNQGGTGSRTTSPTIVQLQTTNTIMSTEGPFFTPLGSGDTGVRSIESINISSSIGGGTLAVLIHRPIYLIPQVVNSWVERSGAQLLGGVINLPMGSDSQLGCLSVMSSSSTGTLSAYIAMVRTFYG